jgi:hypothetical protein
MSSYETATVIDDPKFQVLQSSIDGGMVDARNVFQTIEEMAPTSLGWTCLGQYKSSLTAISTYGKYLPTEHPATFPLKLSSRLCSCRA